jgi:hypothetical protein
MKKSSTMTLPDISDVTDEMLKDETTLNNIRTLLINGALNVVNNKLVICIGLFERFCSLF